VPGAPKGPAPANAEEEGEGGGDGGEGTGGAGGRSYPGWDPATIARDFDKMNLAGE